MAGAGREKAVRTLEEIERDLQESLLQLLEKAEATM